MSEIGFTDDLFDLLLVDGEEIWAGADRHLKHLGSGENASIYAHPEREDLVIRCSCFNDGWIRFADEIIRGEVASPFVPKVFAVAHVSMGSGDFSDRWLAISERLMPIDGNDPDALAVARAACRVMYFSKLCGASKQDIELLRIAQPGYVEFAAQAPTDGHWDDTHGTTRDDSPNYMMRADGTVVVNDPIYLIDNETNECEGIAERLRERYGTGRQLSCPHAYRMVP